MDRARKPDPRCPLTVTREAPGPHVGLLALTSGCTCQAPFLPQIPVAVAPRRASLQCLLTAMPTCLPVRTP
jgi:hypothetical protein